MKHLLAILTLALTAASCSTITVQNRHDESEDFSRFRSYAWMPKAKATGNVPIDEPAVDRRIKKVVEEQLHFKGFRKASATEADFLIGYQVAVDSQLSANDVATHYDFDTTKTDPKLIGSVQTDSSARDLTYVRTYEQGTLILNVADAKSNELVWWSTAQAEVSAADSIEVRRKRIQKAVSQMLKEFPPK
ncbi:MAG: DUF4136 domain-containing protein [Verrucomicrobiales bacterium]|nr:DUF4136 domain-containing protein [Verrucomicrobiales bacterium]